MLLKRRLLRTLLLAFFSVFSALWMVPQIGVTVVAEGAFAAEHSEEHAAEEATLARAPAAARMAVEQAPPESGLIAARFTRRTQLRLTAAQHRARLASYDPPARSPPFRLLN